MKMGKLNGLKIVPMEFIRLFLTKLVGRLFLER